jgi:hypothetical protein
VQWPVRDEPLEEGEEFAEASHEVVFPFWSLLGGSLNATSRCGWNDDVVVGFGVT